MVRIADLTGELYRRNRLLAVVAWLHVLLFVATLVLISVDNRLVLGINTWIKPAKFMASIAVYLMTVAWFSAYIGKPRWRIRTVSAIIATVIVIESACILLQAGRGTTSHFNFSTDFDALIFAVMGVMIGIDMLMTVFILAMFRKPSIEMSPAYLWSIRIGIVLFLIGGWIGGQMIGNQAHTVGAPDGGPGLPFFGWSTIAGDLRISHGLALHALQVLPLAGYAISRWSVIQDRIGKLVAVGLVSVMYAAVVYVTYSQATAGNPLIGP